MWGAFYGPLLVALGSMFGMPRVRAAGAVVSAGYAVAMADIGRSAVVPGANDNLSAVAVLVSLARALAQAPPGGVRVILLSTGSEESFSEGMQAWGQRHFPSLRREATTFVCLDTVGSPQLALLEGEGMLGIHDYAPGLKAAIRATADELGVFLYPKLRFRNATDAVIALKAGYSSAMIGSCDEFKAPSNYHWPTDTPENLDYGSIGDCARLCLELTRRPLPARPG
jgi:Zn-dependent M28 family amino/carboxypeptidase